jgi:hypothetical protein
MNILFDSKGAQVQVNNATNGARLKTWLDELKAAGYNSNFTDYTQPITAQSVDENQLANNSVLITTTHQWVFSGGDIPEGTNFSYGFPGTKGDNGRPFFEITGLQKWIHEGGSLLLFTNHSETLEQPRSYGPYWPINDIQLTAALGITLAYAVYGLGSSQMQLASDAPVQISKGVTDGIYSVDSGGIITSVTTSGVTSQVLVPLPAGVRDSSGLGYDPSQCAFSSLYQFGKGKIIVIGHSGMVGSPGTNFPSRGQIGEGSNLKFLMNCVDYLSGKAI